MPFRRKKDEKLAKQDKVAESCTFKAGPLKFGVKTTYAPRQLPGTTRTDTATVVTQDGGMLTTITNVAAYAEPVAKIFGVATTAWFAWNKYNQSQTGNKK